MNEQQYIATQIIPYAKSLIQMLKQDGDVQPALSELEACINYILVKRGFETISIENGRG